MVGMEVTLTWPGHWTHMRSQVQAAATSGNRDLGLVQANRIDYSYSSYFVEHPEHLDMTGHDYVRKLSKSRHRPPSIVARMRTPELSKETQLSCANCRAQ